MDIVIVGAGLGGLAAAAVLQRRGHSVRVLEQSAQAGEVGAGIQMSANAMKVLDAIGLRDTLAATAVRPKAFEFRRFDSGELLHRLPLGDAHEQRHGAPYFQLHRADLHAALLQAVLAHDPGAVTLNLLDERLAAALDDDRDVLSVTEASYADSIVLDGQVLHVRAEDIATGDDVIGDGDADAVLVVVEGEGVAGLVLEYCDAGQQGFAPFGGEAGICGQRERE